MARGSSFEARLVRCSLARVRELTPVTRADRRAFRAAHRDWEVRLDDDELVVRRRSRNQARSVEPGWRARLSLEESGSAVYARGELRTSLIGYAIPAVQLVVGVLMALIGVVAVIAGAGGGVAVVFAIAAVLVLIGVVGLLGGGASPYAETSTRDFLRELYEG